MKEIIKNIYVGNISEIPPKLLQPEAWAIVNLSAKMHRVFHGNRKLTSLDQCYVIHEEPVLLSLNWVDANEAKYFDYQGKGVENIIKIIYFIKEMKQREKNILISCDKGISRSPSIALIYAAYAHQIRSENYLFATEDFLKLYPEYNPGKGIKDFIINNWDKFGI